MLLQEKQIVEVTVDQPGSQLSLECMVNLLLRYPSKRLPMHQTGGASKLMQRWGLVVSPARKLGELNRITGLKQFVDLHIHQKIRLKLHAVKSVRLQMMRDVPRKARRNHL